MGKFPKLSEYPNSLEINDQLWRVKFYTPKTLQEARDAGLCHYPERTISINRFQSREEAFATLIHEIVHAFEYELRLEVDHKLVYKLERLIFNFLTHNIGDLNKTIFKGKKMKKKTKPVGAVKPKSKKKK